MLDTIRRMRPPAFAWLAAGALALAVQFALGALIAHALLRRRSVESDQGCREMGVDVPPGELAPVPTPGFIGHRLEFGWWPLGYRCVLDHETHRVVHERWTLTVALLLAIVLVGAAAVLIGIARDRAIGIGPVVPMPRDALVRRALGSVPIVAGTLPLLRLFWRFEREALAVGALDAAGATAALALPPLVAIGIGARLHLAAGPRHDRLRGPVQNSRSSPDSSPRISS